MNDYKAYDDFEPDVSTPTILNLKQMNPQQISNAQRGLIAYLENLKEINDWTYDDLAECCHVSRSHLYEILKGRKVPSLTLVENIADRLRISVAVLLKL